MKQKWYQNDWFITISASVAIVATAVANYLFNGGHVVW